MSDQAESRAGDRDRDRVAERLRAAVGEGRITLDELTERLDRVYTARTSSCTWRTAVVDFRAARPGRRRAAVVRAHRRRHLNALPPNPLTIENADSR
ncbi:DUF1707 domain-containing protein [Microbispora sp. H10830]|uniref:DUF1707 SHOCT-like domain-containing protein n=1 Tax=Microbispora sp. H10830 TaxID=2729109 RepID=UPI0016041BC6|nr:DUF1707 domain-containing protein [Microbispora sp. H10830]